VRATHYLATRAGNDYLVLTNQVAMALNDVALTTDAARRLTIVEKARSTLADWPKNHFNYKQAEVRQMLGMLDEAIADLRAESGADRFDLTFVATADVPSVLEPLLPPPTPKEAIEQVLSAVRLADLPAERSSLLATVLIALDRDLAALPSDWAAATRAATTADIAREVEIDHQYQLLTSRILRQAEQRARAADVRGLERLLTRLHWRDEELGARRPDTVNAIVETVKAQLDAAQRLQLARDRWALRLPEFRTYGASITEPVERLNRLKPSLEDIKSLAGSTPGTLAYIQRACVQILKAVSAIVPPEEFRPAHALLVSAAQIADTAASIRREATLSGDFARARDASSAAAGALMLSVRARTEIQTLLGLPQLPR
jgi:hypothetical protein